MSDVQLLNIQQNIWGWLLRHLLLPVGDRVFGQSMMQRLNFLEKAQWWDRERLYAKRDSDLQQLIQIAYRDVPFYRKIMEDADLAPDEIRKPGDLHRLPVVTKDMFRTNFPTRTTRRTGYKTELVHTSGSTGKNFTVLEDTNTAGWYRAAFMLALQWSGWQFGERQLQTGMSLQRNLPKRLKDSLLRCHYVSAFDLTDTHLDAILSELEKYQIQYIWGYPGSLYYLARRAQKVGWNQPLQSAVTWGDNLFPHYRQMIEEVFQIRVFDTYGCGEGIQISAQCEQMTYHVHTLDTIVEYLDDEGQPVLPNQPGNLVLTRLHPGAMPLIRYYVGDVGVAGTQTECLCGRHLDQMEMIQGRNTDVVVTPSGNRLIVHFFTGILEFFPEIDEFQVIQEQPSEMILRLVPQSLITSEKVQEIIHVLKERGASDMKIEVELVDKIPLPPNGKRRFVLNKTGLL